MTKDNRIEFNVTTGEKTVIELTAKEIADRAALAEANEAARVADESAKAAAKAALLERLGITEDEAKLLIG
jgi:non-ribosomal peptide synthetase component E (peptide arylation enzyme)